MPSSFLCRSVKIKARKRTISWERASPETVWDCVGKHLCVCPRRPTSPALCFAAPALNPFFPALNEKRKKKKEAFWSTAWPRSPGGLFVSLLFACRELADLAGCRNAFAWRVGWRGGPALSFGFAGQRHRFCPVDTHWFGQSWAVVCVPLIQIIFDDLS